ncbi:hypothetical protein P9597_03795 [Aneurinibacillus migulanus]|uniref:hypothetical protein n=1 Tax=Aneurinibacillus migulanus TaxID=47500 RepID=UPI002E1AD77D|nr:hypothetical protein [Aneurinibacillus migulanus]
MKQTKKYRQRVGIGLCILSLSTAFALAGCTSKENLPTERELSAKIAEKQEQKREKQMTDTKKELDSYFNSLAAGVKTLGDKKEAFFEAFSGLSEKKLTEKEAQVRVSSAITNYEKELSNLTSLKIPPYEEIQQFHKEMYLAMEAYVPVMKKADKGLRNRDANVLKEVEKQMLSLDNQAKKVLEKTANLQIQINANQ